MADDIMALLWSTAPRLQWNPQSSLGPLALHPLGDWPWSAFAEGDTGGCLGHPLSVSAPLLSFAQTMTLRCSVGRPIHSASTRLGADSDPDLGLRGNK